MALFSVPAFLGEDLAQAIPGQPDDPDVGDGIWQEDSPTKPRNKHAHPFQEHDDLLQNLRYGQPEDLKDLENLLIQSETNLGQKKRKIGLLKMDGEFFTGKHSLSYKGRNSVNCGALCGAILGPHTVDWRAVRSDVAKDDDDDVSLLSSGIFSMQGQSKDADVDMGVFTHTQT